MAKPTTAALTRLFKKIQPCNRKLFPHEYHGQFTLTELLLLVDLFGIKDQHRDKVQWAAHVAWWRERQKAGEGGLFCFMFIPNKRLREHQCWSYVQENHIPR